MKPTRPEDRSRSLSEDALKSDPVEQFSSWLGEAVGAGLPEPNAMVLATTSARGTATPGRCCSRATMPADSCSTPTGPRAKERIWP